MYQNEFIYGFSALHAMQKGCVATIGSFDGIHKGHQVVLKQVIDKARSMALPSVVMVFEPQPHEFFSKECAPARLMRLREKVAGLTEIGINYVVCLKFNLFLRNLTASDYISRVLVEGVGVKHLVIGDDFRFGCDRSGDFDMLCAAGATYGFSVCDTSTTLSGGERISSTRIRKLLETDGFEDASNLLGRPYTVTGRVVYGRQLGRSIGFATANIGLGRYRSPVNGVFAVDFICRGKRYNAVANVGIRPTVGGRNKPILEVHVLDFDLEIYGEFVSVEFKQKIRDEKRFDSIEALQAQIASDIEDARKLFTN